MQSEKNYLFKHGMPNINKHANSIWSLDPNNSAALHLNLPPNPLRLSDYHATSVIINNNRAPFPVRQKEDTEVIRCNIVVYL